MWYGAYWRDGRERKLQIGNLRTGQVFKEIVIEGNHPKPTFAIAPDGSMVARTDFSDVIVYSRNGKKLCQIPDYNDGQISFLTPKELVFLPRFDTKGGNVYDPTTGKLVKTLSAKTEIFSTTRFSPTAQEMAGVHSGSEMSVYDLSTGKLKSTKRMFPFSVKCYGYSRDGSQVGALGGLSVAELRVFDSQTLSELSKFPLDFEVSRNADEIKAPTVESFDGNKYWLVLGRYLIDSSSGAMVWNNPRVEAGDSIRVGSLDESRILWMLKKGGQCSFEAQEIPWPEIRRPEESKVREAEKPVVNLAKGDPLSKLNDTEFVTYYKDISVPLIIPNAQSAWFGLLDITDESFTAQNLLTGQTRKIKIANHSRDASLSDDGETLALNEYEKLVLYSLKSEKKQEIALDTSGPKLFVGNNKLLVFGGIRNPVGILIDVSNGKTIKTFSCNLSTPSRILLSPDATLVAGTTNNGDSLVFYDLASGKIKHIWNHNNKKEFPEHIRDFCFCRNGQEIAVSDGEIRIYDYESGDLISHMDNLPFKVGGVPTGPIVESFSTPRKWMVMGRAIYDGNMGKVVWEEDNKGRKPTDYLRYRRMIDDTRQLNFIDRDGKGRTEIRKVIITRPVGS